MYLVVILFTSLQSSRAQNNEPFIIPRTNTQSTIKQNIASTSIQITYNRPNKRGRVLFGDLIPYGKIWRTGSEEATKIYFSTPVKLAGHPVDSGTYELFTIPGPAEWEIIMQAPSHQWGSYRYQMANDVLRFKILTTELAEPVETFTISLDDIGPDHGILHLAWDRVCVPIPIWVDLKMTVVPSLEQLLTSEGRRPYFQAAMFYYENDLDIDRAAELMAMALDQNPGHLGMLYRQALILKRKGDLAGAIHSAEQSLAAAQKADEELQREYIRLNTLLLEALRDPAHRQ